MIRAVGVDLSLGSTGVALEDRTVAVHVAGRAALRLIGIRERVMELCAAADIVVLEGFAFSRNGHGHDEIVGLGWIVRVALTEARIPWTSVAPTALKKYATGKGNTDKLQVIRSAERRTGMEFATSDEADAFWLRAMAVDHYTDMPLIDLPIIHRDALTKVVWPRLAGDPTVRGFDAVAR